MKIIAATLLASAALATTLHAGPRTSVSYSVLADDIDDGGRRTSSPAYTNDGSIGGIAGTPSSASTNYAAKAGYIGPLYEVTGLTLTAVALNVNEGATDQIGAWQALDDATFLAVPTTSVVWSVQSGPLTGISASGLATAGVVYQDSAATAQGEFAGFTATLGLTVIDSIPDNFGSYGGDGLGDDWQFQYFGPNNPAAAPGIDPDGDGQTNLFEFIAGLVPTDPASRFTLTVQPVAEQPTQKKLLFAPLAAGRTYTVKFRTDLTAGTWTTLPGATFTDNGLERTVTDPVATEPRKYYRVEITKP